LLCRRHAVQASKGPVLCIELEKLPVVDLRERESEGTITHRAT
jgi:hypothetical protein